jgi:hypothetical protein
MIGEPEEVNVTGFGDGTAHGQSAVFLVFSVLVTAPRQGEHAIAEFRLQRREYPVFLRRQGI